MTQQQVVDGVCERLKGEVSTKTQLKRRMDADPGGWAWVHPGVFPVFPPPLDQGPDFAARAPCIAVVPIKTDMNDDEATLTLRLDITVWDPGGVQGEADAGDAWRGMDNLAEAALAVIRRRPLIGGAQVMPQIKRGRYIKYEEVAVVWPVCMGWVELQIRYGAKVAPETIYPELID